MDAVPRGDGLPAAAGPPTSTLPASPHTVLGRGAGVDAVSDMLKDTAAAAGGTFGVGESPSPRLSTLHRRRSGGCRALSGACHACDACWIRPVAARAARRASPSGLGSVPSIRPTLDETPPRPRPSCATGMRCGPTPTLARSSGLPLPPPVKQAGSPRARAIAEEEVCTGGPESRAEWPQKLGPGAGAAANATAAARRWLPPVPPNNGGMPSRGMLRRMPAAQAAALAIAACSASVCEALNERGWECENMPPAPAQLARKPAPRKCRLVQRELPGGSR